MQIGTENIDIGSGWRKDDLIKSLFAEVKERGKTINELTWGGLIGVFFAMIVGLYALDGMERMMEKLVFIMNALVVKALEEPVTP